MTPHTAPMEAQYIQRIAEELKISAKQAAAAVILLDDGASVPFIARYRKEATGSLDEVAVTAVRDRIAQLRELDNRREAILGSIQEQGKLTDDLKAKIVKAQTMAVLEDLYLPYKPKRRTKATVAKEMGLEPLAKMIFEQTGVDPLAAAKEFVNAEKGVMGDQEALSGARDIVAEWVNEDPQARARLRKLYLDEAVMQTKVIRGKEEEGVKFKDYFAWQELAKNAPSHRILAVRRGEKEGILMLKIQPEEESAVRILEDLFVKGSGADSRQVKLAVHDSFKRLLSLSLENEVRLELKKRADAEAIDIFSRNLRELLMAPPLGQKSVIAVDPGLRTGCKVVCLDAQGKLLHNDTFYIVGSPHQQQEAADVLKKLCSKYKPEVIAIGNGTAGRETEEFVRSAGIPEGISVVVVNEAGASIYSASEAAREEFPDHDVTVRGAVSIGRRLMDPLAELVKIDPKNIGVGQYQHDVDQKLLRRQLDDIVISCVNQVGVELNTASKQLLTYVSGLGPSRAQAVLEYRQKHGAFKSREDLRKIEGLGSKAFEQAAGFLRIYGAANPLDASAVHPEAYTVVERMAQDLGCPLDELLDNEARIAKIDLKRYVTGTVGLPTLTDIRQELLKPGRDPRPPFSVFKFKEGVRTMSDLAPGMKLKGVVTNITAFGVFVDIGVHHDGLIHISQLSDRFVKNPHDIVKVHQPLDVTVLEVDTARGRIALSARKKP